MDFFELFLGIFGRLFSGWEPGPSSSSARVEAVLKGGAELDPNG